MSDRLKGSFNVFKLIPVFHDNSGWWCLEPNSKDSLIDATQSDLDIAVANVIKDYEAKGVIIVHTAFTSEIRRFITYVNCDEKALIELLKNGHLRGLF
jgi:hypothetical protein